MIWITLFCSGGQLPVPHQFRRRSGLYLTWFTASRKRSLNKTNILPTQYLGHHHISTPTQNRASIMSFSTFFCVPFHLPPSVYISGPAAILATSRQ
jgi:hypothetical protein